MSHLEGGAHVPPTSLAASSLSRSPRSRAASSARPGAHPPEGAVHGTKHDLRRARAATRQFRNVKVARAAGYAATGECAQDPKYGGMGIHYANPELVADGQLDVTKPEILVYQPMPSGKLRLGAVEYFQADADQDLATDPDRPYLFGMPFDGPMLGHDARDADPLRPARLALPPQPGRPVRHVEPARALPGGREVHAGGPHRIDARSVTTGR